MLKLDSESLAILKPAVIRSWQTVGMDVMMAAEEVGEVLDNDAAMEVSLDADGLLYHGRSKEAHTLFRALIDEYGYSKVFKFLCKNIQLA